MPRPQVRSESEKTGAKDKTQTIHLLPCPNVLSLVLSNRDFKKSFFHEKITAMTGCEERRLWKANFRKRGSSLLTMNQAT